MLLYTDTMSFADIEAKVTRLNKLGLITDTPFAVRRKPRNLTLKEHQAMAIWQVGVEMPTTSPITSDSLEAFSAKVHTA